MPILETTITGQEEGWFDLQHLTPMVIMTMTEIGWRCQQTEDSGWFVATDDVLGVVSMAETHHEAVEGWIQEVKKYYSWLETQVKNKNTLSSKESGDMFLIKKRFMR